MLIGPRTDSGHTVTSFVLRAPVFEQGIDQHMSMLVIISIVVLGVSRSSCHWGGIMLIPGLSLVIRLVGCMIPAWWSIDVCCLEGLTN